MGDCNSDPTSGCSGDGALVAALEASNSDVSNKLSEIISKLDTITTNAEECCELTTDLLAEMSAKFTTLIENSESFYESLLTKLETISSLYENCSGESETPLKSYNISFASHVCVEVDA